MDAPQTDSLAAAGAELALPYLEGTEEFAAFAARARDGIARARVSPPILPLWWPRCGAPARARRRAGWRLWSRTTTRRAR